MCGKSTLARACRARPRDRPIRSTGDPSPPCRAAIRPRIVLSAAGPTLHWPLTFERLCGLGRLSPPCSRCEDLSDTTPQRSNARWFAPTYRGALHIATELSGGRSARVLFARALAVEAPGLIADALLASPSPATRST